MSEAQVATLTSKPSYDDRVDLNADISSWQSLKILSRSLHLLKHAKHLFISKFLLSAVALFPALMIPWVAKIIVDQVLLQTPFGETDVRFPPFMNPLIDYVSGMEPLGIMATIVIMYMVMLVIFGVRGPRGGTSTYYLNFAQGQDSATQAEVALSTGISSAGGIWGVTDMLVHVRLTQRIANVLRTQLFEHMSRLPMTTLDDHRIGDSIYRVMYDAPQVPVICFNLTLAPFLAILLALASLYLMQYSYGEVAPELVWIAAALLPMALVLTVPLSAISRRLNQASRASGAATTNTLEQSMDNIGAIQSLGGMEQETERFEKHSAESFKRYRFAFLFQQVVLVIGAACTFAAGVYVAILVTDFIIGGVMSPGDFMVLIGLYMSLGGAALQIGMYWINLQANVAAVRRVFFFIDYPVEDPGSEEHKVAPVLESVRMEDVTFAYPDGRKALTDINLEFSIGELVALVGPTGAGKTSLAYMIPGFLLPSTGKVLFDGQDIAGLNVNSLRDQVTYVFQEHILLSESIRENLLLANPSATEDQIVEALETAGAMEFVRQLPAGVDTVLGTAGNTLSVGQQQRLCIARGLIRDTKILILDEPTAALDPQTENALVEALLAAAKGRLVVVIAHRLSTIRRADRIVFLEQGRVEDIGSHDALMQVPDGAYRKFVDLQNA